MRNCDMGLEGLPDDLTPFITRTTQDHINGGAFGDVWKCKYNTDDISAVVAVKAFRYPEHYCDSEKVIQKISREIGILKILRHKNIVPLLGTVTGFGRRPELRSLVTPWIPNGTLNVYLESNHNNLSMLDRSCMLEDVIAGLRYLHSVPVVHGDITGANILIDEGGQAKLIDFGLSTIVRPLFGQSHLVATSIRPGAIRYAAPELLSEKAFDLPLEKCDIYSFGCVMLQILSGRHPWFEIKSLNPEFTICNLISQGRSPQRPYGGGYPAIMDSDWDMIQKCLQLRCELRPSADEVLDFVIHRRSSSDSSSTFNDSPDDAQNGFPGASLHDDADHSDITERLPNSPQPHRDHELTIPIIDPQPQKSSSCTSLSSLDSTSAVTVFGTPCSSPQSLSDTDAETVFDTACSSFRSPSTGSWSLLSSLETGPMRSSDAGSRVVRSTSIPGYEHRQPTPPILPPPPPNASNREQTRLRKRNIVIFGKTGSGKSSIINTIAQNQLAETSNDTYRCTSTTQRYQVEISGQTFVLIDTAGLNSGVAAKAENQLKNLLCELMNPRSDGIGLLVYCVHCTTPLRALVKDYTTFYSGICRENVPIVIVVTGLEKMTPMEVWWDTNWREIESLGMHFADHACVTGLPNICTHRVTESSQILRNLIVNNFSEWVVNYSFSLPDARNIISLREKTIVIFGNNGSGISSIINVIAREQLAKTSCDAHGCTSTPQRYQVEISGHRFVLFDTASLNQGAGGTVTTAKAEKQLGSLLRKLMNSKSDEIGLLVYCMRKTTAPSIVAEAYNKFYSGICQKKVPIVIVITGLEKETHMESWWDTNRKKFEGMHFAGHACITTIQMYPGIPDDYTRRVAESSDILRDLIVNHYPDLAVDNRRFNQICSTWTVTGMPIKRGSTASGK